MEWTKVVTAVLLIVFIGVLVVWDVYVAVNPIPGDTISEVVRNFARRHLVVPFAVGVVCGHLFWCGR